MTISFKETGLYFLHSTFNHLVSAAIIIPIPDSLMVWYVADEGPEYVTFLAFSCPCTANLPIALFNVSVGRNSFCSSNTSKKRLATLSSLSANGHKHKNVCSSFKKGNTLSNIIGFT